MGGWVGGTGCRAEKRLGEARAGAEVKAQSLWGPGTKPAEMRMVRGLRTGKQSYPFSPGLKDTKGVHPYQTHKCR